MSAGITQNYIGVQMEAHLVGIEGGRKFKIPYTDKYLYFGLEGNLFGVGVETYIKDGKLK